MANKVTGKIVMIAGLIILIGGVAFIVLGVMTRVEILAGLADEEVTTTINDETIPVDSAETAMNQANVIKSHTLERYGTYGSMERDDPNRDIFINGLTLRNSLIIARMGLSISLLVMGLGGLFILVGASLTLIGLGKKE